MGKVTEQERQYEHHATDWSAVRQRVGECAQSD